MNLDNIKFDSDYWNGILPRINKNIRQFFLISKNIDIDISLNRKLGSKLSTYCKKINSQKYKVFIGKELLEEINLCLTREYNNESSLLFKDIPFDCFDETIILIKEFIIEFIALHEFSHIMGKHFEIKSDKNEHIVKDINLLEVDADRFGSMLLAGKYLSIIEKYGKQKYSYLIRTLIYVQFYIFEIRFKLEPKKNQAYHIQRITLGSNGFTEAIYRNPSLLSLSFNEIKKISMDCIINYFFEYKLSPDEIKYILNNQDKILKAYIYFREKYELDKKWENSLS
ncbi:hypothetical protein [Poseidonibacter lekithochrous]|uniref:hypothetical protein n=1 Tax=Poseidonibacter lekithochrous TaxID=1904463 RepID=UPI0008FCABA1|nr:hypothetical protein [Poseidonibacter lekithochrous]QKJ22319.1 hypothetical protein ALEK_1039 [Poseidonibacter lekithochrous]